jgi:hypothetical protein
VIQIDRGISGVRIANTRRRGALHSVIRRTRAGSNDFGRFVEYG